MALFVQRSDRPNPSGLLVIVLSLLSIQALTRSVSRDLEAVSTQLHAAPSARSLFAGVIEMQNTLPTFANTAPIRFCEQRRRAVCQGSKQVLGLARLKPSFH